MTPRPDPVRRPAVAPAHGLADPPRRRRGDGPGWAVLMTWDHLLAIEGPWEQPELEGWSVLAAWAALTERVELGLLVGANTFRDPGLTAKLAVTLDHISDGRAILGLGAAWHEREHEAHGIDFGTSPGVRLDRLNEALGIIRRLLVGERFDFDGEHYHLRDVVHAPLPVRRPLPILVGGSGPRKTLRIVATHADAWDTAGPLDVVRERAACSTSIARRSDATRPRSSAGTTCRS